MMKSVSAAVIVLFALANRCHAHDQLLEDNNKLPVVSNNLGLTSLLDAVVGAGLTSNFNDPEGHFTFFAPTNEAFANVPDWVEDCISNYTGLRDVVLFHGVKGPAHPVPLAELTNDLILPTASRKDLRINVYTNDNGDPLVTAQCVPLDLSRADNVGDNGILHVIDGVMVPPFGNINEYLEIWPETQTMYDATVFANVSRRLGSSVFTLLAPSNEAFAKLPTDQWDALNSHYLNMDAMLKGTVINGTFCSSSLKDGDVLKTFFGKDLNVAINADGDITINGARIITPDGSVTNGVVHVIDEVITHGVDFTTLSF